MRSASRSAATFALCGVLVTALAACATGDGRDRLPDALAAADDRVVSVETSTGYEGVAPYLSVAVDIDDDSMTEDQLRVMLTAIVDTVGSGYREVSLGVRDGREPGTHEGYIDLGDLAADLSVPLVDPDTDVLIRMAWDDLEAARSGWREG